jgi:beta-lactam-binding protein with PASTA domain
VNPVPPAQLRNFGRSEFCRVPSLKRFKKQAAKQALTGADCGVKVKKRPTHKRKLRGKVLKQKLPPGTTAAPGTAIPVVIGQK